MFTEVFVRSAYNYDRDEVSNETAIASFDASKAKQSFAEECDINTIVRRFGLTGEMPVGLRTPTYEDFSEVTDFATAMNAIVRARESFDAMPAHVRARFHNDPQEFLEFCADENNSPEAVKLGLVLPKAEALVAGVEAPGAAAAAPSSAPGAAGA